MSTSSDIVKNISTAFIQLIKSQVFDDIKETTDVKSKYTDKIIEHLKSKVSDYEQIITENITSIVEKIEKTKKTESKSKRKSRKPKDPLAPKKPLTSFILFGNDNRNKIKKDNPELKSTEISKELGKRWRELSYKKKHKYIKLESDDMERYEYFRKIAIRKKIWKDLEELKREHYIKCGTIINNTRTYQSFLEKKYGIS